MLSLTTSDKCHNLRDRGPASCWQQHWQHAVKPDTSSESPVLPTQAAFDATIKGGSHRNIATPFGIEKLEWCGYLTVKKMKAFLLVLTECTKVTDRQTKTPHDGVGRACKASCGKNQRFPKTATRNSNFQSLKRSKLWGKRPPIIRLATGLCWTNVDSRQR